MTIGVAGVLLAGDINLWLIMLYRSYQTITSLSVLFVFDSLTELLRQRYE